MAGSADPAYGTPNWEMLQRWLTLPPEADGPFWALNLMKYRPVAAYTDGRDDTVSGKAADDAYAPLGPLAAVGATVAFHGDVVDQRAGDPAWDRVGIVRYPNARAAFFAMQQRDDFKDQHVHKEAGMEFTIVMACRPDGPPGDGVADDRLVLVVARGGEEPAMVDGIEPVVTFSVEGVIVGDDRTFDRAWFATARDDAALDALVATIAPADDAHVLVVDRGIDRLVDSVRAGRLGALTMEVLRTPDNRFADLEGWDFEPKYVEVAAADGTPLRCHFVDEGPRDGAVIVLLHGNPSWSYLHREMIRGLVARGHRAVALDLIGFGRSDKPAARAAYTLDAHVDWLEQWLVGSGLTDITLYCQDWGGLAGLQLLPRQPDRFARIVASNTGIPSGEGANEFMEKWLRFSQSVDTLPIGGLLNNGTGRDLSPAELAAYEAPFPDGRYQAGALQFPLLIPVQPDNPGVPMCRATWEFLAGWTKPFLTVMGSEDAIAYKPGAHRKFQRVVPGAAGLDHVVIEGAGHFIQEDAPDRLVEIIDAFVRGGGRA